VTATLAELEARVIALEGEEGDRVEDTLLTIDPATGAVGADYSGHVFARGGLDLVLGDFASPPEDRKIRWLRSSDNVPVADIRAWSSAVGQNESLVEITALDKDTPNHSAVLQVNSGGDGSVPLIQVAAALQNKIIITSSGLSDYVQRNALGAEKMTWGSGTVTGALAASRDAIFNHGLANAPVVVFWSTDDATKVGGVQAVTATQITLRFRDYQAGNFQTVNYNWLAIG
jgi:hypothetical protein